MHWSFGTVAPSFSFTFSALLSSVSLGLSSSTVHSLSRSPFHSAFMETDSKLTFINDNPINNNLFLFGTYEQTFFTMFALQTTTNFPDIMLLTYSSQRLSALYFVIYMIIQYFLLMNMIAGVYYFNYKNVLVQSVSKTTTSVSLLEIIQEFLDLENFDKKKFCQAFEDYLRKPELKLKQEESHEEIKSNERNENTRKSKLMVEKRDINEMEVFEWERETEEDHQ